ncbi:MAG TPA: hypothetical protein VFR93_04765 [Candidatus Limnocylindrales bacterium]|nr:hypothetical protein [Candidatus Limnocylindrales bacterium]
MLDANGVAAGIVVAIAVGLVAIARETRFGDRLPGSFGEGFLRFRRDGWPRGVQEDDDARWRWSSDGTAGPPPDPGLRPQPPRPPWLAARQAVPPRGPQRH